MMKNGKEPDASLNVRVWYLIQKRNTGSRYYWKGQRDYQVAKEDKKMKGGEFDENTLIMCVKI